MLGNHTSFLGWTVTSEDYEGLLLAVRPAPPAVTCDMCTDLDGNQAAEYRVDSGPLGPDSHDVYYCHNHLLHVIETYGPDAGELWEPPDEFATGTALQYPVSGKHRALKARRLMRSR